MMILCAEVTSSGSPSVYYFANKMYASMHADVLPDTLFVDRLTNVQYERAITYAFWNRGGAAQAIKSIDLINNDGELDSFLAIVWKGETITLKIVEEYGSYDDAQVVGVMVIDKLEVVSEDYLRFVCKSYYEQFDHTLTSVYPDTITNESLRGQPKPILLGHVRWAIPLNPTLNDSGGSQRAVMDLCDGNFESIEEVRTDAALSTESIDRLVVNSGPPGQWFVIQDESPDAWTDASGYGFFMREQDQKVACEVYGQVRVGTQIITDGDFPSDDGSGNPVNFDITETPGNSEVLWAAAGVVNIDSDGVAAGFLTQDVTSFGGRLYLIQVTVETNTGVLSLINGSTSVRDIDGSGPIKVSVVVPGGVSDTWGVGYLTGVSGSCTISSFQVYEVYRINNLTEILRFVAVTRGTLALADIDTTATDGIQTTLGYSGIGFYSQGQEISGKELLDRLANSYAACFFQDASGVLTAHRLVSPASPTYYLTELQVTDLQYEVDTAPGLSTRMKYGYNYAKHTDDESLLADCGGDALLQAELRNEWKVVTTTATPHAMYSEAADREPLESLLSLMADAQDAIDHICDLYTVVRGFYTLRLQVDEATPFQYEPGTVVNLVHSRYGLSGGKNLVIILNRATFLSNVVDLVLWG